MKRTRLTEKLEGIFAEYLSRLPGPGLRLQLPRRVVHRLQNEIGELQRNTIQFHDLQSRVELLKSLARNNEVDSVLELLGGKVKGNKKFSNGLKVQVRNLYSNLVGVPETQHASFQIMQIPSLHKNPTLLDENPDWLRKSLMLIRRKPGPLSHAQAITLLSILFEVGRRTVVRWIEERPSKDKIKTLSAIMKL